MTTPRNPFFPRLVPKQKGPSYVHQTRRQRDGAAFSLVNKLLDPLGSEAEA